ncbi:MAG: hypothetical protein O3A48_05160, partial [Actinomycetota bacterium]|nr:hypothetical protein [Actinomycetota bacterium]
DVRSDQVKSALTFEDSEVEALEIIISENCQVLDKSLSEIQLPKDCLIAGVTRRENTYIPSGTWKFAQKDRIIVFSLPTSIENIEEMFC